MYLIFAANYPSFMYDCVYIFRACHSMCFTRYMLCVYAYICIIWHSEYRKEYVNIIWRCIRKADLCGCVSRPAYDLLAYRKTVIQFFFFFRKLLYSLLLYTAVFHLLLLYYLRVAKNHFKEVLFLLFRNK